MKGVGAFVMSSLTSWVGLLVERRRYLTPFTRTVRLTPPRVTRAAR